MKRELRGHHFDCDESLKDYVKEWFETKDAEFHHKGITALRERWDRVRGVEGSDIE